MNKKNIDNIISEYFKNIEEMPKDTEEFIKNINFTKPTKHGKYKIVEILKIIGTIGVLSATTVYGAYLVNKYSNVYDEGIKKAIDDGYIYEPQEVKFSDNGVLKVGVNSLLLDDYNLNLNVDLEFKKDVNIEGYEQLKVENVIVYDEKNNIYYYDTTNIISEFAKNKKISENDLQFVGGSSGISIYNVNKNTGILNFIFKQEKHKYPKSKKIYVEFGTIKFANNINKSKENMSFNGEWKTEISVPEKFQDREGILYNIEKCDYRIDKNKFQIEITETGTKLNMVMQWGDYEYWTKKLDEIRQKDVMGGRYIRTENCYIENERGEKFYATFEGSGARLNTDGTMEVMCNFSCLKSNCTNKMKIILVDINDEKIEINLMK